jgi:hypothetical protein
MAEEPETRPGLPAPPIQSVPAQLRHKWSISADLSWAFKRLLELFSWTGIGWAVALFIGLWGAMVGVGQFIPAYIFGGLAWLLCVLKWGHATHINEKRRKIWAFSLGLVVLFAIAVWTVKWTIDRAADADRQAANLAQLREIPSLKRRVDRLPELERRARSPG